MRIVSLLPSATEIVCAIGLEDELVAVTHECDWPPSVVGKPVVTRDASGGTGVGSREIHERVTAAMHGGSSLYELDEAALAAAEPDLILTQELCRVCAVSYREVNEVARRIDADITVLSLEPTSIEGIFHTITTVGAMTEAEDAAIDLVEALRERLAAVERTVATPTRCRRPRAAGRGPRVAGPAVLGRSLGSRADPTGRRLGPAGHRWRQGPAERRGMPSPRSIPRCCSSCPAGSTSPRRSREWERWTSPSGCRTCQRSRRGAVFAVDGSAYFSRPGPRVIDGIELLAEIMDPAAFVDIAPPGSWTPVPVA